MPHLIKTIKGLKPQHRLEFPLFEKTYIPSGHGDQLVSRLYADGSLYYLSHAKTNCLNNEDEKWNFISTISEKGINGILSVLEKCRETAIPEQPDGNNPGAITWKFANNGQILKMTIPLIHGGELKIFDEIEVLINSNIQPIPHS